jgi:hypothetical protein
MKLPTIKAIIELRGGNLTAVNGLTGFHTTVKSGSFMPLTIEGIGTGPYGYQAVSVCHYFEQNGDLMQDPEIMFEYNNGEFFPYAIQQAPLNRYAEVYRCDTSRDYRGKPTGADLGLKKELEEFAAMWDRNLRDQGFVVAAKTAPVVEN